MNPRVKTVIANRDFTLTLTFTNGEEKLFDVKPYLDKGQFKALKEWFLFRQTSVKMGTVNWPHELDISPDTLYLESFPVHRSESTAHFG